MRGANPSSLIPLSAPLRPKPVRTAASTRDGTWARAALDVEDPKECPIRIRDVGVPIRGEV